MAITKHIIVLDDGSTPADNSAYLEEIHFQHTRTVSSRKVMLGPEERAYVRFAGKDYGVEELAAMFLYVQAEGLEIVPLGDSFDIVEKGT